MKPTNKKTNKTNNNNKTTKNNRKTNRRKWRTRTAFRPRRKRNGMMAAQTNKFKKEFRILYQDGNTVKVTGRDLIYKIPNDIEGASTNIITCIPANPAYWIGTRISALAQGYQNYRPIAMNFTYIPQCAVTQQGNVLCGTLWNQAPSNTNLQQSLRTSNGGAISQCYAKFTSKVRMKTNLQYNLYRMGGQFDQESNPFIFLALALACKNSNNQQIIPGYFYVTWSFILKNPIGSNITYGNTGLILYKDIETLPENKTIVYLSQTDNMIKCGSIIQLEDDDNDAIVPKYNGSLCTPNENDPVWQFYNNATDVQTTRTNDKITLTYSLETNDNIIITAYPQNPPTNYANEFSVKTIIYDDPEDDYYEVWQPETWNTLNLIDFDTATNFSLANNATAYVSLIEQIPGIYQTNKSVPVVDPPQNMTNRITVSVFYAPKSQFRLIQISTNLVKNNLLTPKIIKAQDPDIPKDVLEQLRYQNLHDLKMNKINILPKQYKYQEEEEDLKDDLHPDELKFKLYIPPNNLPQNMREHHSVDKNYNDPYTNILKHPQKHNTITNETPKA